MDLHYVGSYDYWMNHVCDRDLWERFCEHGTYLSVSMEGREFLDHFREYQLITHYFAGFMEQLKYIQPCGLCSLYPIAYSFILYQPPVQWVPGLSRGKKWRGVTLTPHSLLVPWSRKSTTIPLLPLWAVRPVQSLSACTVQLYLYSPYWPYGLYRTSAPVQGCTFYPRR